MKLYNDRNKIIKLFEDKNIKPSDYPDNAKSEPEEFEESIAERRKMRRQKNLMKKNTVNEFNKLIVAKDKSINKDLIEKHFEIQSLVDMQKQLYKTKNTEENKKLVQLVDSRLSDLEKEIQKMS